MARKKSIIPGFSLNRALGITSAKQKIARATGIPTTKQGRKRKMQSHLWTAAAAGIASALSQPAQNSKITAPMQSHEYTTVSPEDMYDAAVCAVIDAGEASVSILQRSLRIGYAQAAKLLDQMTDDGIVGPFEGDKPREVLITRDQWEGETPDDPDYGYADDQYYNYSSYDPEPPKRKPLYKRVWFWILVILLVSGLRTRIAKWQAARNQREEARVLAELAERDAQKQAETAVSKPDMPAEEERPSITEDHTSDDPEPEQEELEEEDAVPKTSDTTKAAASETTGNVTTIVVPVTPSTETTTSNAEPVGQTYVLNTSTHKFHRQSCSSVKKIDPENYSTYTGTRDSVISMGYEACGRCHP